MADEVTLVVPKREDAFDRGVTVSTPLDLPNVRVTAMPWWQIVLVRTLKAYINSLVAFVTALAAGAGDHIGLMATHNILLGAAELSIYPAALALITNVGMLLTRLDEQVPHSWHA